MTPTRVFVVEDERIIARGIEKRLKGLGYAVAGSAANGEDAVRMVADLRPDVVLMDINLGNGMDGIEAGDLIRTRCDIPVVYLTAFSDDATLQRAKLTWPHGYVLKPYDDKTLQIAIEFGVYRHRADRQVRENERWLAAILASIGDGLIATDEHGRVRLVNAVAESLTGWPAADAAGRDVSEVFKTVDELTRQPVGNPALSVLRSGEVKLCGPTTTLLDRNGTGRLVEDSAAPIRDTTGRVSGSVLAFRDVSDRRRLEAYAFEARKLRAIGRMAAGIAHDFNNLLTVVNGYAELLACGDVSGDDRVHFARHIVDAGRKAAGITQRFLSFGQKQMLVSRAFDPNDMIRDMTHSIEQIIGSDVVLDMSLSDGVGRLTADPAQFRDVIRAVVARARDVMTTGDRLTISTSLVDLLPSSDRLPPGATPGAYIELTFADTGRERSEECIARFFEPYTGLETDQIEHSLDLAAAYGFINQSGGFIDVTSRANHGNRIRIHWPSA